MEDNSQNKNINNGENEESADNTSYEQKNSGAEEAKNDPTEELSAQLQKAQNDLLYAKADFENYKKRVIREQSELRKYGSEHLIRSLLDIMDNFERALELEVTPENIKSFSEGMKMLHNEFKTVLNRFGVSEIDSQGKPFDPNIHEAMGTESTSEVPSGHVFKTFTKPYKLHDKIVRHGRVIVSVEPKTEG